MRGVAVTLGTFIPSKKGPDISNIQSFSEYEASLDKYRLFKSRMFVVTGSKWDELSRSRQVCLGAQTSIDKLHWILQTVTNWSGPVSIALFVPDIEFHISQVYLNFSRRCFPAIKEQVSTSKLPPRNLKLSSMKRMIKNNALA